jgi:hypothetical protein
MLKLTAALNQAISSYYRSDPCAPSLISSFLPAKKATAKHGEWYFSIVRYTLKFGRGKYVVINGKGHDYVEGLKALASDWLLSIGNTTNTNELVRLQKILLEKP